MKPSFQTVWGRLRDGLEEGISVLWKGTSEVTLKTMAEADVLRLRMEIRKRRSKLNETYERLGHLFFEGISEKKMGDEKDRLDLSVEELRSEIHRMEHDLRQVEVEISDLKTLHQNPP